MVHLRYKALRVIRERSVEASRSRSFEVIGHAGEKMIERVLREEVGAQTVRLELLTALLGHLLEAAMEQDASTRHTVLFASVLKARQAGKAVRLLAKQGFVEEIMAIGRTLIEVTVNAAYLQSAGDRELDRYLDYQAPVQQGQGGLVRQGKSTSLAVGLVQRLGALVLRNGGSARKGEDAGWTARSLMDRARISDSVSSIPVMVALVERVFPKGHAAVHGTVASLRPFVASLERGEGPQAEDRYQALTEAFFGINLSLLTLCHYLNSYFRLGMEEAIEGASGADSRTRASLLGD